jgi:uncharacterized protein YbcI
MSADRRAEISNAITAAMRRFYGKGPERARTYFCDDNVVVVLQGGLTASEETLLTAGREQVIREYREQFQEVVTAELMRTVAEITNRDVLTYHSQMLFRPTRIFEIFVLDRPVDAGQDAGGDAA